MRFFYKKNTGNYLDDRFLIQADKIQDNFLEDGYKRKWVEDAWLGEGSGAINKPLTEFLGVAIGGRILKITMIMVVAIIFLIGVRLFYLQILQGEKFLSSAEDNRLRSQPIIAERGVIYDRNSTPLITNISSFNLVLLPQLLPKDDLQIEAILKKIAIISGEKIEELRKKIDLWKNSNYQSVILVENIDYQKAVKLVVESADLPGVSLEQTYKRFYRFNPIATSPIGKITASSSEKIIQASSLSHIIGYTGKLTKEDLSQYPKYLLTDDIGKTGLEKSFEVILRGEYGQKKIEVDAFGKEKNVVKITPPQPGKNLILTIDLAYQKKLEEIVINNLRVTGKKKAAAIVMNPQNGEILAMVNWPSFNNNLFANGISEEDYQKLLIDIDAPLFSRVWSGLYPSGSTVKIVVASGALSEGIINRSTTIISSGGIRVDRWFFPDWKAGGHGATNVTKAIAESVNTFFYIIGGGYQNFAGLGLEKLAFYFTKFGLGKKLGLDIPNEAAGFIPTREWKEKIKGEKWYIGDTYNLSIGQGDLLVTPLQIASLTATVANGGTIYQPHVVKKIINPLDGSAEDEKVNILAKNVVAENFLQIVCEGMRQTVTDGSAISLATLPIKVAGKTGTAQWSSKAENHAWFTSFAPFDNPQIVVTILVEEGGEGSAVAAPIAKEFYQWWAINNPQ